MNHTRNITLLPLLLLFACAITTAQSPPARRATSDQQRQYFFAPTGQQMPYRLYVPTKWDGKRPLPILLFLHGAHTNERMYLEMADSLVRKLAGQHGYSVVWPRVFEFFNAAGRSTAGRQP